MNLQELNERLQKEFDELINEGLEWSIDNDENEHVYFVNHAYEFAHYEEIISLFEYMEEEDYEEDWKELFDLIPDTTCILKGIYRCWLNYNHPERYNFFAYEDLVDIVQDWLNRHK